MNQVHSPYLRLGLTGYPLGHSLSPILQTAAMRAMGLPGEYNLYPVEPLPAGRSALVALLSRVREGEVQGLNVTIPHKQAVLPLVDEITPLASAIGAANVLYMRDGLLLAHNTDGAGFLNDLRRLAPDLFVDPHNQQALVLGAGGSARSVVYMLLQAGWQVMLVARRPAQAQELLSTLDSNLPGQKARNLDWARLAGLDLSGFDLLVNTTPLGMAPDVAASPWPTNLPLPPRAFVYDLVYNPLETRLVSDARRRSLEGGGGTGANGLGMLVEQAALAFRCWTGLDVSPAVLWAAVSDFTGQGSPREG